MDSSEMMQISTKENETLSLSKKAAEMSKLLKGAIQDFPGEITVPLTDIDKLTALRVIDYLNHYVDTAPPEIEKPLRSENMKENTDEYSANLVDGLSFEDLEELTLAANFMEIQPLLDLCCAKYVSLVKDKTEEEIMKLYNIDTPFTEELKQQIRDENPWLEEGPDSMK